MRYSLPYAVLLASVVLGKRFQAPLYDDYTTPSQGERQGAIPQGITDDPDKVKDKNYDYIIAGGGLTGLTLATKLVRANFTVLVIESGFYGSEYGPIIDDLNKYGQIFGSSVDHAYETTPQVAANDGQLGLEKDIQTIRSGNGLGGSTLINGGTWTRPHKSQLDSWDTVFGNDGWTWGKLKQYMDEIENPRDPMSDGITPNSLHHFNPECHNRDSSKGYVSVGARDRGNNWSPLIGALMNTVNTTYPDVKNEKDLCCGDPTGVSMFLNTLTKEQVRTDAARSWLKPILDDPELRKRITVLTGKLVGKVHLEAITGGDSDSPQYQAHGVEFGVHKKPEWNENAYANKEVLLAAGSTISPLILQWSGIGPKHWLEDADIDPKVDLPVGYNLQDQTTTSVVTTAIKEGHGQGQAAYFATFKEVFAGQAKRWEDRLRNPKWLKRYAEETVRGGGFPGTFKAALVKQYENYRQWLLDDKVSFAELFLDTDNKIHFDLWNLIPFTRGYVKVLDSDPYLRSFEYNPRYFANDIDLYGQAAATRLARNLSNTHDMKTFADNEIVPGLQVDEGASLDDWTDYVKNNYRANYHAVGTCSMMKKELGGVVDNEAKVYNVKGLRVVDGSIPPTQLSSHVMTVFYAMAAKIADSVIADGEASMERDSRPAMCPGGNYAYGMK